MGRPIRPLDPSGGPAERFACELRALRAWSGDLPFWKMARRCAVSKSALASAVAGRNIPSERVAREFVRACGGDWNQWQIRWRQAIADVEALCEAALAEGSVIRAPLVVARPTRPAIADDDAGGPCRSRAEDPGTRQRLTGPRRRWRPGVVIATVLTAAAFVAGWLSGVAAARPAVAHVASAPTGTGTRAADGYDPYIRGCGADQTILERRTIYRADASFYGWLLLYFSPRCSAAWGYVVGPNSPRWTVHIRALRVTDSVMADSSFRGLAPPNSWGNMLSVQTGCVRAEAWIDGGAHAMTSCWSPRGPVVHQSCSNKAAPGRT